MSRNLRNLELAAVRLYESETSVEAVAARHGLDPESIIDFSLNINPFGPPESAVAAAGDALRTSNYYPDLRFSRLRAALADRHSVEQEALFFGSGLDDVIKLFIHAWTREGDAVLVHLPTFPRYELEARLRGCKVVGIANPDRPERIDVAALRAALTVGEIALCFLCTPNNPTGARLAGEDVEGFASSFPDTIFIVDEALIFPLDDGMLPLQRRYANVAVLRTFSKYFGLAGLRIGYAVGDPELLQVAEVGRPPFNMASPSVEAATAALSDAAFLTRCKTVFAEEAAYFSEAIGSIPDISIRGVNANMLLLDVGSRNPAALADALAARGIVVADATSFRGLEEHSMLRVSLRGRTENLELISALGVVA